ncbi:MAG: IS21 family transposase [Candidatus Omnitrophica bacterium]|nr:IS21 family transposase [Candidatus Omnitrophota bacterium]MBU4590006.1 IS21 family transposase [Candidatus Omnitrophota bacterium]
MNVEVWAEVRRLYFIEHLSMRRIAKIMHLDRKTVRRAIQMEEYRSRKNMSLNRHSKLDRHKKDMSELLEKYNSLSAERIYEEIKKKGYSGKISILRDYLRKVRDTKKEAYLRIETLPGEQAQVDWLDCGTIKIGEYTRKLSCFVMVLSYSRLMYLEFTLSQRLETFIQCHINAFRFFKGIPKKILYDNLKTVVLVRFGREVRFNPRFEAFRGYYIFEASLCNPYAAHEKGKVESGVKYVKHNFLKGRIFKSFTDLKEQSMKWLIGTANIRIHGTTHKRPVDLYDMEKDKLMALPDKDYDARVIIPAKSTKDCRVRFDSNAYSVPFQYACKALTLKATDTEVVIYNNNTLIAQHKRTYEKYLSIEDPRHYQELIAMKKKALKYKKRDEFLGLGDGCEEYLKGMVNCELNLSHHIEKILGMVNIYGKKIVLQAINHALKYRAFGSSYIKNIILQHRKGRDKHINPISIQGSGEFNNASVEERDLDLYDDLFSEEE